MVDDVQRTRDDDALISGTDNHNASEWELLLSDAYRRGLAFRQSLPDPAKRVRSVAEVRELFSAPLTDDGEDALGVIADLDAAVTSSYTGTTGGRYFGMVIGASLPIGVAADWLTAAYDQCSGLFGASASGTIIEESCGRYLFDLLGLPVESSFALVTGGQMANWSALAIARHSVLRKAGWDVERRGLIGSPPITVIANEERHLSIDRSVRFLGIGTDAIVDAATDATGAMIPASVAAAIEKVQGPCIVVTQAGNVNGGAIDPIAEIVRIAHAKDAWVHVDGAFGLWAAASPKRRHLLEGYESADSWSTDAHKWPNIPYDCGVVMTRHSQDHLGAMKMAASYLVPDPAAPREPMDWTPELSRRARGFALWTTLRALGRNGVAEMVDRFCDLAQRFASGLEQGGARILNEVTLNQLCVEIDDEETTKEVMRRVQEEGTIWIGPAVWKGRTIMRVSISSAATTKDDVDLGVRIILEAAAAAKRSG